MQEPRDFLADVKVPAGRWVDVQDDGSEWPSEKEMQTHVSNWLATRSARN
jgi:hypothetical protein